MSVARVTHPLLMMLARLATNREIVGLFIASILGDMNW